jgi:disulfide bond formation protein DsbB
LVVRPPRTATDALARIAAGLGAAILFAPATRWGYLIYPLALLGAMIAIAPTTQHRDRTAEPHAHGGSPAGPAEPAASPDTH